MMLEGKDMASPFVKNTFAAIALLALCASPPLHAQLFSELESDV